MPFIRGDCLLLCTGGFECLLCVEFAYLLSFLFSFFLLFLDMKVALLWTRWPKSCFLCKVFKRYWVFITVYLLPEIIEIQLEIVISLRGVGIRIIFLLNLPFISLQKRAKFNRLIMWTHQYFLWTPNLSLSKLPFMLTSKLFSHKFLWFFLWTDRISLGFLLTWTVNFLLWLWR